MSQSVQNRITVDDLGTWLLPRKTAGLWTRIAAWPPNLFAFTSLVLKTNGCYRRMISPLEGKRWPPGGSAEKWDREISQVARGWLAALRAVPFDYDAKNMDLSPGTWKALDQVSKSHRTKKLSEWWKRFLGGKTRPSDGCVWDLESEREQFEELALLIRLHCVADEVCAPLRSHTGKNAAEQAVWRFVQTCNLLAADRGSFATIDADRGRVLAKMHTPPVGISLRSLSHNLAFHQSSVDVQVPVALSISAFSEPVRPRGAHTRVYCLLFPWPFEIPDTVVQPIPCKAVAMNKSRFGFFEYGPEFDRNPFIEALRAALTSMHAKKGRVDLVVLPEMAVHEDWLPEFERVLAEFQVRFYIAGAFRSASSVSRLGTNKLWMKAWIDSKHSSGVQTLRRGRFEGEYQHKHHRWAIDPHQRDAYGFSRLRGRRVYWEGIEIHRRRLLLARDLEGALICPLICEDLARQDPIGELVRSLGPSLVVALLMDGPQYAGRWAGRYASVLAEDPGSSVLTVTSAALERRWRMAMSQGRKPAVIASWTQAGGKPRSLSMRANGLGIALELKRKERTEVSVDGRARKAVGLEYVRHETVGQKTRRRRATVRSAS